MQEWAPQAMLFGLALDLALLGTVYLRLWKDIYKAQLLSFVLLLGSGALAGLIWSDMSSPKAEMFLVVYEAMIPAVLFLQLARFMPRGYFQWALLPVSSVVAIVALYEGWGFQSSEMLAYEAIAFAAQIVLVLAWSAKGTFTEEELHFNLVAQAFLLVLGPGYRLLWPGLELSGAIFAIAGAMAGGLIVVGRMRSAFLHFLVPGAQDRRKTTNAKHGTLPAGIVIVPKEKYDEARTAFEKDIDAGRIGLWISMDPVSHIFGHKKGPTINRGRGLLAAQLTHSSFVDTALEPTNIDALNRSLSEFLKMTGDGMVFIRDFHYLVSNTDIWRMTDLLRSLRDKGPSKRITMLIGADLIDGWEIEHLRKAGVRDWQ